MTEVKIVVGANYGDEGKGLATRFWTLDAIRRGRRCVNVLYNGSSQRGHTVETPSDQRHVFHHFGSGTLDGADTYFDADFMVNPMTFVRELIELKQEFNVLPICFINADCSVVTPFDMLINQIVEYVRSDKRHGSCGSGVWETQQRYMNSRYNLAWRQICLLSIEELTSYLLSIAKHYVSERLDSYGIFQIPEKFASFFEESTVVALIDHYAQDLMTMRNYMLGCVDDNTVFQGYDTVIYEGGQGLALDERNQSAYPHVTASKTGAEVPVRRVMPYTSAIEVCYITRSYLTRHGAGPLPTQCNPKLLGISYVDTTNMPNEFQGAIRYGTLDVNELAERVHLDMSRVFTTGILPRYSLFVTHSDLLHANIRKAIDETFQYVRFAHTKYAEDLFGG